MSQPTFKRRKKLINRDIQVKLVASFGGVALLAMLIQFLIVGYTLTEAVSTLENGGQLASQVPGALVSSLVISLIVLTPIFMMVGVMLTFRYAGPLYRFEQYLLSLSKGESLGPCKIRKGDQLQSLCTAINLATAPLQKSASDEAGDEAVASDRAAA